MKIATLARVKVEAGSVMFALRVKGGEVKFKCMAVCREVVMVSEQMVTSHPVLGSLICGLDVRPTCQRWVFASVGTTVSGEHFDS